MESSQVMNNLYIEALARRVHEANIKWWLDLNNPCVMCGTKGTIHTANKNFICAHCNGFGFMKMQKRNVGELLMLVVSELSEAMEGHRKGLMDDKLPQYRMFDVEIIDAVIRLLDIMGGLIEPEIAGDIFEAKMVYNTQRKDHKIENRLMEGGKKY